MNNAGNITATPTVSSGAASGSDGIDLRTQKTVTVTNTGTISGRHGIATDGSNVGPSLLTVTNNGTIQGVNGSGLNVDANTSISSPNSPTLVIANVTNGVGGTIKGGVLAATTSGDGDGIDIDGVLTLNNSGDVLALGAKGLGSDGGPNNADAIAMGGGSVTNTATGRIIGSTLAADAPNGDSTRAGNGILVDNSGGGNAFAATTVVNDGLIQGKSGIGIKIVGTFNDVITNNATGTISGNSTGATIQMGGGNDTLTNRGAITNTNSSAIDLEDGNDALVVEGGVASIAGNISGGNGTNAFTIKPGASNSFSYAGSLSNFSEVKVESGSVTFTGNNTYSGSTNVTGGTLLLIGGGTIGGGNVTVAAGATLDISGISDSTYTLDSTQALTVGGTINATGKTLATDGSVNPGASPGLMTVEGSLSLLDDSDITFEVDGLNRGVTYDGVDVSGLLTLDGKVFVTGSHIYDLNDTIDLFYFGTIDASGFLPADLILPTLGSGLYWDTSNFLIDGTLTVVPEPSTCALIALGGIALLAARRKRRA